MISGEVYHSFFPELSDARALPAFFTGSNLRASPQQTRLRYFMATLLFLRNVSFEFLFGDAGNFFEAIGLWNTDSGLSYLVGLKTIIIMRRVFWRSPSSPIFP